MRDAVARRAAAPTLLVRKGLRPRGRRLHLPARATCAEPHRYERAALRWHGRLELERSGLMIAQAQLALAALEAAARAASRAS